MEGLTDLDPSIRYQTWDTHYTLHVIGVIWIASSILASPNLFWYNEVSEEFHPI